MQAAGQFAVLGALFGMIFAGPALYGATEKLVGWLALQFYDESGASAIKTIWAFLSWPIAFLLLRATLYSAAVMILITAATYAPRLASAAF